MSWKGWLGVLFLTFWGAGMVTSFSNGACLKGLKTPKLTAQACSVGIAGLAVFYKIGQPQRVSEAELYTAAAIANAKTGRRHKIDPYLRIALDRVLLSYRLVRSEAYFVEMNAQPVPKAFLAILERLYAEGVPPYLPDIWWRMVERRKPELAAVFQSQAEVLH